MVRRGPERIAEVTPVPTVTDTTDTTSKYHEQITASFDKVFEIISSDKKAFKKSVYKVRNNYVDELKAVENNLKSMQNNYVENLYNLGLEGKPSFYVQAVGKNYVNLVQDNLDTAIVNAIEQLNGFLSKNSKKAGIKKVRTAVAELTTALDSLKSAFSADKLYKEGFAIRESVVEARIENLPEGTVFIENSTFDATQYIASSTLAERFSVALKNQPLGSYINGKKYFPLRNTSGNVLKENWYSSRTCFAEAATITDSVFGMDCLGRDGNADFLCLSEISYEAFKDAGVKPFTVIRTKDNDGSDETGHHFVIVGFSQNHVLIADENRDGNPVVIQQFSYAALQKDQLENRRRHIRMAIIGKNYNSLVYGY